MTNKDIFKSALKRYKPARTGMWMLISIISCRATRRDAGKTAELSRFDSGITGNIGIDECGVISDGLVGTISHHGSPEPSSASISV